MKRVFSTPQQPEANQPVEKSHEPVFQPITPVRPAVYVQQITEHHKNTIARILARVQAHNSTDKQE